MKEELTIDKLKYDDKDAGWGYLFAVLISLIFQLIVSIILTIISTKQGTTPTELLKINYVAAIYYTLNGLTFFALFCFFNKFRKKRAFVCAKIDFKIGWKNTLIIVALSIIVLFGFNYFINLLSYLMQLCGYNPDASLPLPLDNVGWLFINLFILALVPAICEELIYRGIIMNGLRKFGNITAIFLSAAIFAVAHGSAMQTIYQFILGVVLGYIVVKTGSLVASMLFHFLNNAMVLVVNYILNVTQSETFASILGTETWTAFDIIFAICMAIATTGAVILLVSFLKSNKKELLYEKTNEKLNPTAIILFIISAVISIIIWCVGTFV